MNTYPGAGIGDSAEVDTDAGAYGVRTPRLAPGWSPVLPLVLLVDTSNSMNERIAAEPAAGRNAPAPRAGHERPLRRLDHLMTAIDRLVAELRQIGDARRGGEIAVLTFGGGGVDPVDLRPPAAADGPPPAFTRLVEAQLPRDLTAYGATPLAEALAIAGNLVEDRLRQLQGRLRYRANVWVLTDGENTDVGGYFEPLAPATIDRLRHLETERKMLLFCAALPGANVGELRRIAPRSTFPCHDAAFRDITRLISFSSREAGEAPHAPAEAIYARVEEAFGRWSG